MMKSSFDLQPTLEDEILILKALKEEDLDDLYKVASDPMIWEQHPSKDRCRRDVFKLFFNDGIASGGAFAVIDKITGQIIGSSGFILLKRVKMPSKLAGAF
jgi:N-acetyltransferase